MQFYLDLPVTFPGGIKKTFDLIVPDGRSQRPPLLIWIHGGGWCGGEKRICNDFERFCWRGYAVLSIDYRFSQDAPFPAQLIDCRTAVRWARAHAAQYGYCADRLLVGGSSAGGHLAAMLGVTNGQAEYNVGPYLEYSSAVQAVVDEFGPADLEPKKLPVLNRELSVLLEDNPETARRASPARLVSGREPPFLILHGADDPSVPVEQSRNFAEALHKAGCTVRYYEVPGGAHGFDTPESYALLTNFVLEQLPAGPCSEGYVRSCPKS